MNPRRCRPTRPRKPDLSDWIALLAIVLLAPGGCGDDRAVPAPVASTGACCSGTECRIVPSSECFGMGVYLGDEVSCAPPACLPEGACCGADVCTVAFEEECIAPAIWLGSDTDCVPDSCPRTGACCLPAGCERLTEPECGVRSGDYWGDESLCEALPDSVGGPNRGGVLLLHYAAGVTPTTAGRSCLLGIQSCDEIVAQAPSDTFVLAAVFAVFPPSAKPSVQSVLFGIQHPIEIVDWLSCGPQFTTTSGWPGPFSGIQVSWGSETISGHLFPVCWFGAYSSDGTLELTGHPELGPARFFDGSIPPAEDRALELGTLGFGPSLGRRRCPCG